MSGADLVDQRFIGIPYKLGGRVVEGADCIGVAILWLESQGITYEYDAGKGRELAHWWDKSPRRFVESMLEVGQLIHWPDVRRFDVLMFITNDRNTFPNCLGIMVDDRHFLSTDLERGSFIQMLNEAWKAKFWGAVRLNKVLEAGL